MAKRGRKKKHLPPEAVGRWVRREIGIAELAAEAGCCLTVAYQKLRELGVVRGPVTISQEVVDRYVRGKLTLLGAAAAAGLDRKTVRAALLRLGVLRTQSQAAALARRRDVKVRRNDAVRRLKAEGWSGRRIARRFRITPQRVYQLLA